MKCLLINRLFTRIKNFSIHTKLMLSTLIVTIIPIIIIFIATSIIFFNVTVDNARTQAQLTLDKTVDEIDLWLSQINERLLALSTDINIQNAIIKYSTQEYKDRLNTRDFIRNSLVNSNTFSMGVVNESIFISDVKKTFSNDFSDLELYDVYYETDWFLSLLSGEANYYFGEGKSIQKGEPVIIMAYSIVSVQDGRIIGISYVELSKKKFYDIFRTLVTDSANAVILGNEIIATPDYVKEGDHISVYSLVKPFNVMAEYRLQLKEVRKGFVVGYVYFALGLISVIFLVYIIDKMFLGWFTRRIIVLRNATKEIASGNLAVAVNDVYKDEIGELSQSFNIMAHDMKQLIERNYISEIENQKARLQALQSQINPHFVYNTLECISMLAVIKDNYEIVEISHAFSLMMRYSMEPKIMVQLADELDNVRNYVTIQKIRLSGIMEVSYRIDQDCLPILMPRLSLQPLVENAIKHGFDDMQDKNRFILITAKKNGAYLIIHVFNNGTAIPKKRIKEIRGIISSGSSIDTMDCFALRNLSRRLHLTYGDRSTFRISSRPGTGTISTIKIPISKLGVAYEETFDLR